MLVQSIQSLQIHGSDELALTHLLSLVFFIYSSLVSCIIYSLLDIHVYICQVMVYYVLYEKFERYIHLQIFRMVHVFDKEGNA